MLVRSPAPIRASALLSNGALSRPFPKQRQQLRLRMDAEQSEDRRQVIANGVLANKEVAGNGGDRGQRSPRNSLTRISHWRLVSCGSWGNSSVRGIDSMSPRRPAARTSAPIWRSRNSSSTKRSSVAPHDGDGGPQVTVLPLGGTDITRPVNTAQGAAGRLSWTHVSQPGTTPLPATMKIDWVAWQY